MKKKHCYAILCIIWMLVIFWFSAQVADDSQEMSDFFVHLLDAVFSLDIMRNEIIRDMTSFLVRKAAHMSEYAVLAILFGLTIREYKKEPWLLLALAATADGIAGLFLARAATAAYAATDEFHQLFVPGRSGQLKDVLIDTAGGALGLVLLALILYLKRRRKMKETEKLS